MSSLRPGDDHLHYSDTSHRWIAPPDIEQSVWEAGMRAHMDKHLTTMGGPARMDPMVQRTSPRIPRQRRQTAAETVPMRRAS